jgi:hypothetical protein
MAVTHSERLVQSVRQQASRMMGPMFEKVLDTRDMTEEKRREAQKFFASFQKKFNAILEDELSWSRLKGMQMQIYRETFSQEEINDLIAFYESPTGQTFVKKMPAVMQKSMQLMQQRMGPMMQRIRQAAEETAQEFRKQNAPTN